MLYFRQTDVCTPGNHQINNLPIHENSGISFQALPSDFFQERPFAITKDESLFQIGD